MRPWMKIASGLLLSILVIGFIIIWDTVIKEEIDSVDVVIVRPGTVISEKEIITAEKLMIEKRNKSTIIEGTVYAPDIDSVVGYEAKQDIYGNTIMSTRDVEYEKFAPNAEKGESIRPIPGEWIYAAPSTIRRKDYIDFYLFRPFKEGAVYEQSIAFQGLSPEQQIQLKKISERIKEENEKYKEEREKIAEDKGIEVEQESKSESTTTTKGNKLLNTHQDTLRKLIMNELNITEEEWVTLTESGDIPLLVDIPIIYVKDGTGNEIQNGEKSSNEDRLTTTGQITNLEVILNEDQYRSIKKYMELGYKLYITYN